MAVASVAQQSPEAAAPATTAAVDDELTLARAMSAYADGNYDDAERLLQRVYASDAGNPACLYYLGLVHLQQGLDQRQRMADPRRSPAERDAAGAAAIAAFEAARSRLRELLGLATEPGVEFVDAALNLAIAELASSVPGMGAEESARRARAAISTLEEYLEVPEGNTDPLAHLFRGIAYQHLVLYGAVGPSERPRLIAQGITAIDDGLRLARQWGPDSPEYTGFRSRALYYRGALNAVARDFQQAREDLQCVAEEGEGETRDSARRLLGVIPEATPVSGLVFGKRPVGPILFRGSLELLQGYDTNVILLGGNTGLPRGLGQHYDYGYGLKAGFDLQRTFTRVDDALPLGESLAVGIGGQTYQLWQAAIEQYDVSQYVGSAFVNWGLTSDLYLGFQYDYSYTLLGHKGFISSNRESAVVNYYWPNRDLGWLKAGRARSELIYQFDYRNYLDQIADPRFDRDGKYHAALFRQHFDIATAGELWRAHYAARDDRAAAHDRQRSLRTYLGYAYRDEQTQGTEFDRRSNGLLAGFSLPLPLRLTFEYDLGLYWDDYGNPSVSDFGRNWRSDLEQWHTFGLIYTIVGRGEHSQLKTLEMTLAAQVDLVINDSSVMNRLGEEFYSYDRAIWGLVFRVRF
jgi:hypothetical protein